MTHQLPTVADIYNGDLVATTDIQKNEQFLALINQPPAPQWIKKNQFANNTPYLPIDKIEYLLKLFFKSHKIEITGQGVAFNGVWVTVRVHYQHPITNEWMFHDGIGASEIQTKKGTSPADMQNINNNALMIAFPKAKTFAVKDACDHLGAIFGQNIGRKDALDYAPDANLLPQPAPAVIDKDYALTIAQSFESLTDPKERAALINGLEQQYWQPVMSDCVYYLNSVEEMKAFFTQLSAPIKHAIQPIFTKRKQELGG